MLLDKALKMGKTSAIGSFHLWIGVVVSNVIMAIGTIILARLLLPSEYGLYSIALMPSLMIVLFRDWGINSAMTKYVAQFKAENKTEETRNVIVAGLIFETGTGLVLSLVSVILASFIASTILQRPDLAPLISIVSVAIFSGSLTTASQSTFIGLERMELNSFIMICQALVKALASPILVLLGYGILGAVLGYTLSFIVSGLLSISILYLVLFKKIKKTSNPKISIYKTLKHLLRYGLPLSISVIISGFLIQIYNLMMAYYCTDALIGNFQICVKFTVLLIFFTLPISTVLFPAFAKLDPEKEQDLMKRIFETSVKYAALLVVPATAAVMVLSKPMIFTLFGDQYTQAPWFLTLYVISYLFVGLGSLSLGNLLTGLGETKTILKMTLLTMFVGLSSAFLLIPNLGIIGVIITNVVAGIPSMLWGLRWILKRYNVTVNWSSSLRIFVASSMAAATTYLCLHFINTAEWVRLLVGGTIFLTIYLVTAPSIGAVTQDDTSNLRAMFSGLGLISRLVNSLLKIPETISAARFGSSNKK